MRSNPEGLGGDRPSESCFATAHRFLRSERFDAFSAPGATEIRIPAILIIIACWALFGTVPRSVAAETWSERLGYPAGKRVLVIYAGQMGAAYEFNQAGQKLLEEDLVQSAGVLPTGPWFDEFAQWSRERPQQDVGISLSLNSPSPVYRLRPLQDRHQVPSLVDADGFLWQSILQVALRADAEQVKREVAAQINRARSAGLRPTHLMTDMGALLTRPDLTRIYLDTAERMWLPAVIVELTPPLIEQLREDGFPITEELIEIVSRYPLPKLDDIKQVPDTDSYEAKRDAFYAMVRELRPGLTQVFLRPAEPSPGLRFITSRWKNQVWESKLLQDPDVQAFMEQEQLLLTSWREIMDCFENVATEAQP